MTGLQKISAWPATRRWPRTGEEKLDRALVAGLILEVLLESPDPAADSLARRRLVKNRLQSTLVSHLAGQVTLDRFRTLMDRLDAWFPFYYPLIAASPAQAGTADAGLLAPPAAGTPPDRQALREAILLAWLDRQAPELLPRRPNSKIQLEPLREFLHRSRGAWFRIKDFQDFFRIDRKTAWEYLQKFAAAGLLDHNRERAAAVRYCLADRFLRVKSGALRRRVTEALPATPAGAAAAVADWLIATGGEAFWEEEWQSRPDLSRLSRVLETLETAGLLLVAAQVGPRRLLRLAPGFIQPPAAEN